MSYNIRDIREKLIGYKLAAAAHYAGISVERLEEIEKGDEPSFYEIEELARIYGIDSEILDQDQIELKRGDSVQILTSQEEFKELTDWIRFGVVKAANAAKDLQTLKVLTRGLPTSDLANSFNSQIEAGLLPWEQGKELANKLRDFFNLGCNAILSMRDFLNKRFPEISLLYACLGSQGPAGITFADDLRGQCIVINLEGKNLNPCVRRFSLAHELCHILYDKRQTEPLATVSGYRKEFQLDPERRANSFAVRFLCPESILASSMEPLELARYLAEVFGIHYGAARLYILNVLKKELPMQPPPNLFDFGNNPYWTNAEEPIGIERFPLPSVPPERRTFIAQHASNLYSSGKISRDRFAEFLGVTPVEEVEVVLDYFAFDWPDAA